MAVLVFTPQPSPRHLLPAGLSCPRRPRPWPHPRNSPMNRRDFLSTSAASGLALSGLYAADPPTKPLRVGVIGTGWYGKCSLFRLLQVDPTVQVVGLCDVDKHMVAEAAQMVEERSGGKSKPKTFGDYRELLTK